VDELLPSPGNERLTSHSTSHKIAARHFRAGRLRTKVLALFDVANNIGKGEDFYAASQDTQQKQKDVAAQIHSLEAAEDENLAAVNNLEAELREHWASYAAYQCRAFCERVRERLPRELRDMVLLALWDDAWHTITDWNVRALATTPEDPVALVETWSGRDTGHCFEERFVGREFREGIVEAWWRMSMFEFKTAQLIPKFISEEFWGGQVKERVRSVFVDLLYRERNGLRLFQAKLGSTVTGASLDSELEHISGLSRSSKVVLAIKKRDFRQAPTTFRERHARFLQAASGLFPGLEKLQEKGYYVSVLVDGDIEIKVDESDISTDGWWKQIRDAEEVRCIWR
jgi:hypothetical protein